MRLVHAAKYNAAVMMFQPKQLVLYGMNMVTVNSRGANQAMREKHDRDYQIVITTDFNNIVNSEEYVEAEAMNPASYVPQNNTKHKPPNLTPREITTSEEKINGSGQSEVQGCGCGHGHGHGQGIGCTSRGRGLIQGRGTGPG